MPLRWKSQKTYIPYFVQTIWMDKQTLTAFKGPQTLSSLQSLPCLRFVIFNELFEVSVRCLNSLNRDLKKERKWWDFLLNSFGGLGIVVCGQESQCALYKVTTRGDLKEQP